MARRKREVTAYDLQMEIDALSYFLNNHADSEAAKQIRIDVKELKKKQQLLNEGKGTA